MKGAISQRALKLIHKSSIGSKELCQQAIKMYSEKIEKWDSQKSICAYRLFLIKNELEASNYLEKKEYHKCTNNSFPFVFMALQSNKQKEKVMLISLLDSEFELLNNYSDLN